MVFLENSIKLAGKYGLVGLIIIVGYLILPTFESLGRVLIALGLVGTGVLMWMDYHFRNKNIELEEYRIRMR
jgi:hypothetical protein